MILTLVCGHRIERANQFSYLIGSDHVVKASHQFYTRSATWSIAFNAWDAEFPAD